MPRRTWPLPVFVILCDGNPLAFFLSRSAGFKTLASNKARYPRRTWRLVKCEGTLANYRIDPP